MSLISVRNVRKSYRLERTEAPALIDVNLDVEPGERVCLMGPSGSGKSTLLNLIGCIDSPTEGSVLVDGEDTGKLGDAKLSDFRNRRMGFIFQSFNLIPVLSVFENVEYPLLLQKVPARERRARVEDLLRKVGLLAFARRSPENLSGGQRQRVSIARALVGRPRLVIADEPTASLDHATGTSIMQLMVDMNETEGATLIFSTHDPDVSRHARRIVTMLDGRIAKDVAAAGSAA
ncbi:MAG TPA: ABC transporter ATP-binding protein [Spirochaetia bacterium]|nr:ABC transporter ATP-binding protein [Spirochaetia bacterium]